ncbi:MAG TPA: DUF4388 domain-containing protein [Vulgatibacter sp.]|nr:DUF4388 domain-containing protein [Vulgatibacter sp.]
MALRGTLKDFGIAEILQLIGQQAKTGVLHLESRSKDSEIHVSFYQGNVVRAEDVGRRKRDFLGRMLVDAQIISEGQLAEALEEQKRTLRRLGDILIDRGMIERDLLKEMAQLQATETLYRLFEWRSGTYRFEQTEVRWDRDWFTPIRSEAVLMEGFRIVDEWPLVRRRITSKLMTFEVLKELPVGRSQPPDLDAELDIAFGEDAPPLASDPDLGDAEERVARLVAPDRTVEEIVALSRLGEFETWKALANLVTAGYLRGIPPSLEAEEAERRARAGFGDHLATAATRLAFTLALAILAALTVHFARTSGAGGSAVDRFIRDTAAERAIAAAQLERIDFALQVYRLEHGKLPGSLEELVVVGLLGEADLRHPWREPYHYRLRDDAQGYVLLPPLR